MIIDLSDERRSVKTWLPDDDRDVTTGRVFAGSIESDGRPLCILHGAMNQVAPAESDEGRIFRCYGCGVGCIWYPTNSIVAKIAFREAWDARCQA